ncbi:PIN domain-containing protein, partial [Ellagibacter isourolithinifaciens]|uniref:PIN domain-containing protein n=1 Tax=Ellagibacter isourolithinifaciens TaxID=2137581 RepID=UPI003A9500FC
MGKIKALLDTNIAIDFLNRRELFYEQARLLMIAGRVGEFDLWIASSQVTDLIYILSEGGKPSLIPKARERIQGLRTFVSVFAVSEREIDKMLASSWKDPEDRLLFEVALSIQADCIITRNK